MKAIRASSIGAKADDRASARHAAPGEDWGMGRLENRAAVRGIAVAVLLFLPLLARADCTGCTTTNVGADVVHVWNNAAACTAGSGNCTFTAPPGVTSIRYLVVGGGGGGGYVTFGNTQGGGGGGAGGYRAATGQAVTPGTPYEISVGAGGTGGSCVLIIIFPICTPAANGGSSSIGALVTAAGGGAGANAGAAGNSGGSGGGGGGGATGNGGAGNTPSTTPAQGRNGGQGSNNGGAGGGGGAGAVGANGANNRNGGNGGNGTANNITGSNVTYAGGGGGGGYDSPNASGGNGGQGGGGSAPDSRGSGGDGTNGLGGGGGGATGSNATLGSVESGGNGGSGVVIIRYTPSTGRYAVASGNWSSTGTWSSTGCNGSAGASVPAAGTDVTICNTRTVTLNVTTPVLGGLTIQETGVLNIGNNTTARALQVGGTLDNAGILRFNTNASHAVTVAGALVNTGAITAANVGGTKTLTVNGLLTNAGTMELAGSGAFTVNANGGLTNSSSLSYTSGQAHVINVTGAFLNSGTFTSSAVGGARTLTVSGLITNSGVFRFAGSAAMTVNANGGILNGGTLDASTASDVSHTLVVGGNFTNNGTVNFAPDGNSFVNTTFNGTSTQVLTGSSASSTFHDLTLDNANGLDLAGTHDAIVTGTLTLTSGRLTTGASNYVHVTDGSNVAGAGANTFVAGNLRKTFSTGSQTRVFEVGTVSGGVRYAPVEIRLGNVTAAGDVTVSSTAGDHPGMGDSTLDSGLSINRYWTVTNNSVSFTAVATNRISFTFVNPDDYDPGVTAANLLAARYDGSAWTEIAPSGVTATVLTIEGTGITGAVLGGDYQLGERRANVPGSIVVTMQGPVAEINAGSIFLLGTANGAPAATGTGTVSANSITTGIGGSLPDGTWLVDIVGSSETGNFTPGSDQSEHWDRSQTTATGAMSTKRASDGVSMTQTHNTSSRLVHAVAAIAPGLSNASISYHSAASASTADGNGDNSPGVQTLNWNHPSTGTASGKLVVGIAVESAADCSGPEIITGVTNNGFALMKAAEVAVAQGGRCYRAEIWYIDFGSPMSCFTDDFQRPNGDPGPDWLVSSGAGSFGVPRIVNGRLRLTDASTYVSTMATLQKLFPAAGNRIEVEFQHFAYGGNGADGIVVVFSDEEVEPAPGAYGGSLGYAQQTDIDGFAGGWLGVGIDEFGNFSNPTEGRQGGPGFVVDSVAIRGSGSGRTGYRYHTGTGTLSPGVDENGSASPPHRYRVVIDHTNGVNAWVSVERDTGSGYVSIIAPYDAKAMTGQADVPTELRMSFTGSTGASTNIHEIDNLRVCAAAISGVSTLDHIRLLHDGDALTCAPEEVTIQACQTADCSTLYTDEVTTTLGPAGWVGGDTIVFSGGSTTAQLRHTTPGPVSLDAFSTAPAVAGPTRCFAGMTETCTLTFHESGFIFDVPTVTAGLDSPPVTITAVKTSDSGQTCAPAFSGPRTVNFWSTYVNPGSGTQQVSVAGTPVATGLPGTGVNLNFDANAQATFVVNYGDAGLMQLNARHEGTGDEAGLVMTGSDQFVAVPAGLCVETASSCSAPYDTCDVFGKAGNPFDLAVKAVAWQSGGESDSDFCDNPVTPNFRLNGIALSSTLVAPAGGANATLGVTSIDVTAGGTKTEDAQTVSEVGVFRVTATAPAYFGETIAPSSSAPIGRFTPARLGISANTPEFAHACGAGAGAFTYMDQGFRFHTAPELTVTGLNAAGNTTLNYGGEGVAGNDFWKLASVLANRSYDDPDRPTFGALPGSHATLSGAGDYDGKGILTLPAGNAGDEFLYARGATPVAPFNAKVDAVFPAGDLTDSDGICYDPDQNGSCDAFRIDDITGTGPGTAQQRFGRLVIGSAFGSELLPLAIALRAEYFDGTAFVVNTDDVCTGFAPADLVLSSAVESGQTDGNVQVAPGGVTTATVANDPFAAGEGGLTLSAPGEGNTGHVDITVDLGTLGMEWLRFDTDGDGSHDDDPVGRASFGIYPGDGDFIYIREPWD